MLVTGAASNRSLPGRKERRPYDLKPISVSTRKLLKKPHQLFWNQPCTLESMNTHWIHHRGEGELAFQDLLVTRPTAKRHRKKISVSIPPDLTSDQMVNFWRLIKSRQKNERIERRKKFAHSWLPANIPLLLFVSFSILWLWTSWFYKETV